MSSFAHQCPLCLKDFKLPHFHSGAQHKHGKGVQVLARILPSCGHVFCENCIETKLIQPVDINAEEIDDLECMITCPYNHCKKEMKHLGRSCKSFLVSSYNVGQLVSQAVNKSKQVDHMLELMNKSQLTLKPYKEKKKQIIEKCMECEEVAVLNCIQCTNNYCKTCYTRIHQFHVFANHQSQPIKERTISTESATDDLPDFNDTLCSEHNKYYGYYCSDCEQAVCDSCVVLGSHHGHIVEELRCKNEELLEQLMTSKEQVEQAIAFNYNSRTALMKELKGRKSEIQVEELKRIQSYFSLIHCKLQLHEHSLMEQAKGSSVDNSNLFIDFNSKLLESQERLDKLHNGVSSLLSSSEGQASHADYNLYLITARQLLQDLPCYLNVDDNKSDSTVEVRMDEDLVNRLDSIVTLHSTEEPDEVESSRYTLLALCEVPESIERPIYQKNQTNIQTTSLKSRHSSTSSLDQQIHPLNAIQVIPPVAPVKPSNYPDYYPDASLRSPGASSQGSYSSSRQHSYSAYEYQPYKRTSSDFYKEPSRRNQHHNIGRGTAANLYDTSPLEFQPGIQQAHNTHYNDRDRQLAITTPRDPYNPYGSGRRQQTRGQPSDDMRTSSRDIRMKDPRFSTDPNFTVYEGYVPTNEYIRPFNNKLHSGGPPGVGRGRGKALPVQSVKAVPKETESNKPLFMNPAFPITDMSIAVEVVHVESPSEIWVIPSNKKGAYNKLKPRLQVHGNKSAVLGDLFKVRFLLARDDKGQWSRAEVLSTSDRHVTVFFVDIGYKRTLQPNDLRKIIGSLLSLPKQAVRVHLQGIAPIDGGDDWDSQAETYIREMLGRSRGVTLKNLCPSEVKIQNAQLDSLPCELLIRDEQPTPLAVREMLVFLEIAIWHHAQYPNLDPIRQDYLSPAPIKVGDSWGMVTPHAVSPNEIYAQKVCARFVPHSTGSGFTLEEEVDDCDSLIKIQDLMLDRYENASSKLIHRVIAPRPGMVCAALFESAWYRAVIRTVLAGRVKVYFIDYGNTATVIPDEIRTIPPEYMRLPSQTYIMKLYGVRPIEGNQYSKLVNEAISEMLTDNPCTITAVTSSNDTNGFYVHIVMRDTGENIANNFIENGLVKKDDQAKTVPVMVAIQSTATGVNAPPPVPVEVSTHIVLTSESPAEIYVRTQEQHAQFESLLSRLTGLYQSNNEYSNINEIQVGNMYIMDLYAEIVRVIALNINPDNLKITVQLVDSGLITKIHMSKFRPLLDSDIINLPALCSLVSLNRVRPSGGDTWGSNSRTFVQELLEDVDECVVIPEGAKTRQKSADGSVGKVYDCTPGDIIIEHELPSHIKGAEGEIEKISLRQKLVEAGLALTIKPDNALKLDSPSKTGSACTSRRVTTKHQLVSSFRPASDSNTKLKMSTSPGGSIHAQLDDVADSLSAGTADVTQSLLREAALKMEKFAALNPQESPIRSTPNSSIDDLTTKPSWADLSEF